MFKMINTRIVAEAVRQQRILSQVSQNSTLRFLRMTSPTRRPMTTPERWAR